MSGSGFVWPNNYFNELINKKGILVPAKARITSLADIFKLLKKELGSSKALLIPYYTVTGSSRRVSTYLVEEVGSKVFLTSLRKSDLFFRKPSTPAYLYEKVFMKNNVLEYDRISAQAATASLPAYEPARGIFTAFGLKSLFTGALDNFSGQLKTGNCSCGSRGMVKYLKMQEDKFEEYRRLSEEGFSSALSGQAYSLLYNAYSPFLVFLKYCAANNIEPCSGFSKVRGKILRKIKAINTMEEVSLNLAILFGKRPNRTRYDSFLSAIEEICRDYALLEEMVLSLR
jgi:hypothetical protein